MVRPTSDDFFSPFFLLILFTFSASNEIYISSAEIRFLAAIFIISLSVDRRDRQGTKKKRKYERKKKDSLLVNMKFITNWRQLI